MGKYTTNLYSVAAEYQFLPNEKFVIQTGIAYDYFKPEGAVADTDVASGIDTPKPASTDEINSNLNLKYYYSSNLSFHCGIANKSRFPRLKELYSLHAGGNPELETEKTVSREIGLDFVHKSFKTSASLFLDNIKDYIQRNSNKEYVNLAKTEIKGLELSSIYLLNNNDYFKVNYTYLSIKDDDTNDRLTERPKHKLNAIIAKKLWYETKVMFLMSYTGEQYISTTDKVGGFCLYDINLSKNIKYKNNADFELFLNVKNIFDRDYDEGNGPSEGRNIKIGMKSYF
jgi:outer membrane cobalamin receptor